MAIHPNLRKGSMSPIEKAKKLANQSIGKFYPSNKPEPYYAAPLNINNRDFMISSVEIISRSNELNEEDKNWWKEVLFELKKMP